MAMRKSIALSPAQRVKGVKGLSVRELLEATQRHWHERVDKANDCTVKGVYRPSNGHGHLVVLAHVESGTEKGKTYMTWFNFLDARRPTKTQYVMAQCECADYKFVFEYANAAHSAARIFCGNGEPPSSRNQGMVPGLCKHLVCLAREIFK